MHTLKVMILNAQDLFLFMDKHNHTGPAVTELNEIKWQLMSSSLFSNKSKEKCLMLAQTILDTDADIVMVSEVGGEESLSNFADHLLSGAYKACSMPSNSDRGIDLGYLIKKNLPYHFKIKSNINYSLPAPSLRFSRDVLELQASLGQEVKFIFLLTHIKSKLDLKKTDFEGRTRRTHEVGALVDIYLKRSLEYPNIPIFVGGDMNGVASEVGTEEEFKPIYERTDLKDIAHMAQIPPEERFSYVYFNRGGNRFEQQIDYLFLSEKYKDLIVSEECFFPRYKNTLGAPLPIPKRMEQKNLLPSDHYPFLATLKI